MKSIAIYIILTFMISFSVQNSDTTSNTIEKKHTPCESKCMACQQTAYNIKFYQKPNCKKNHCKTTCYKVHSMWNAPASVFANFKNDSLGKCEVCFRAGFCTMSECSVQKKFEISVINSTVDKAKLNGIVDDKPLKEMLKKLMNNKKVDFKKMTKKVKKNLKKAKKFVNKKAEKKLIKAVSILNGGKAKKSGSKASKKKLSSSKLIKIIRSSLKKFRANVSICISLKKNKKAFNKKKKELKKQYDSIKKSIQSFIVSFGKNLKTLEATEINFTKKISLLGNLKKNENLTNLLKVMSMTISKIKNEAKEAKQALEALKKIYLSIK